MFKCIIFIYVQTYSLLVCMIIICIDILYVGYDFYMHINIIRHIKLYSNTIGRKIGRKI